MEDLVIDPVAVLIAALSMFVMGGLWYSVLFASAWQRLAGLTDGQLASRRGLVFGGAFVLALVMAASLAAFIGDEGLAFGVFAGASAGVTFVAAAMGITALFERKRLAHFAIDAGYHAIAFTTMGVILGAMQA